MTTAPVMKLAATADSLEIRIPASVQFTKLDEIPLLLSLSINGHVIVQQKLVDLDDLSSNQTFVFPYTWVSLKQLTSERGLSTDLPVKGNVLVAAALLEDGTRNVVAQCDRTLPVVRFIHSQIQQQGRAMEDTPGCRRLITGALQAASEEKHRWVFNFPCRMYADRVLVVRVVFCDVHPYNKDTYIHWYQGGRQEMATSNKKRKRIPIEGKENQSFALFLPQGSYERQIGLEIGQSDRSSENAIRYAVFASEFSPPALSPASFTLATPVAAPSRKRALLVGVSKYRRPGISPLQFCDEDVAAWYRFLKANGYAIELYGDEYSPYPVWHGPATVDNVRAAVGRMVNATTPDDHVVFVVSGHGSGNGSGSSHLCLLADADGQDENARSGQYWDVDIARDLRGPDGNINRAKTFVFFDACFSGGIREELVAAVPCIFGTSTCTEDGFGYDSGSVGHGAWTAQFLCEGLMKVPCGGGGEQQTKGQDVDLFELYLKSRAAYVRKYPRRGDRPCFFAGRDKKRWLGEAGPLGAPHGLFMLSDWLTQ